METTVEKINIKGFLETRSKENLMQYKQLYNKGNKYYNKVIILTNEDSKHKITLWEPYRFQFKALNLKFYDKVIIKNLYLYKDDQYNWGNI